MANINFPSEMKIMKGIVVGRDIVAEMNSSGLGVGELLKLEIPNALVILEVKEVRGRVVRFKIKEIFKMEVN